MLATAQVELSLQPHQLALATDERGLESHSTRPCRRDHADKFTAHDAARLPLRLDGHRLGELEGRADRGGRSLSDEDLSGSRCLLEPGRDIDGIARDEGAAFPRPADDYLSGVDTDAKREPLAEQLAQPQLHRQRRVQRSLCMILPRRGRSEDGNDRVADELLDSASTERDLRRHRIVEAVEEVASVLGVERAAELGGSDQVGEQHRRKLSLLDGWLGLDRGSTR